VADEVERAELLLHLVLVLLVAVEGVVTRDHQVVQVVQVVAVDTVPVQALEPQGKVIVVVGDLPVAPVTLLAAVVVAQEVLGKLLRTEMERQVAPGLLLQLAVLQ
jgi:hypothetical protein